MTSDHLFPILENERDSEMRCWRQASSLQRCWRVCVWGGRQLFGSQMERPGHHCGRQHPLAGGTNDREADCQAEKASAPNQCALNTTARCEYLDPEATIVSIDGVGAYDSMSRNAMLEGVLRMENGERVLPFVRRFYGPHPLTSGSFAGYRMHKGRAESREIRSCPCSPVWGNIAHLRPLQVDSRKERGCLHTDDVHVVVQPCQGLGGACDSRSRAGAPCPHPSAFGEDANLESRRDCSHRRGRIDCCSKASQTRLPFGEGMHSCHWKARVCECLEHP